MKYRVCDGLRGIGLALAILATLAVQSAGFVHGHPAGAGVRSVPVSSAAHAAPAVEPRSAQAAEDPAAGGSSTCVLCDALRGRVALAEAAPAALAGPVAQTAPRCRPAAWPLPSRPELSGSAPRAPPLPA